MQLSKTFKVFWTQLSRPLNKQISNFPPSLLIGPGLSAGAHQQVWNTHICSKCIDWSDATGPGDVHAGDVAKSDSSTIG